MRRGTRVGQAYVAVTADGSGINEEIVDSVDEAGPGVEKAGKDHGDRYGENFGEGLGGRLGKIRARLGAALSDRLEGAGREAGTRAGDDAGDSFVSRMSEKTKDLGERIGARLSDQITEGLGDRIEMSLAGVMNEVEDLLDRMEASRKVSRNPRTPTAPTSDRTLSDRVGGLLGAGSRNNALNLFGKSIGGLIGSVGKLQSLSSSMFATFQKGWADAGEGASVFQKAVAGGGAAGTRAMASLAASGPAAAAAILIVVGAMSVMASVASALLAIVTALASTIVTALAGALLVASAGFAATAAAAGLLVVAFTSMTDAQQALLSDAFQPLKAELTGIGQLMITQMIPYFATWSGNLQEALALAAPAAAVMGAAFGQAGAALTAALSGPGFQNFANALTVWLPSITAKMSAALGSFLNGLTGTFGALLPLVDRFAGYLAAVAERFSKWANSAEGQNAIVDFTERAVDSLLSLWGFVREFVGFVADVLFSPQAQEFGNGMFDGLAGSFDRLRKKIEGGELQEWFDEASRFGEQLWNVMVALTETFAALNNSGVLEGVALGLSMLAGSIETVNFLLEPLIDLIGVGLTNAALAVTDPLDAITNRIQSMGSIVRDFLDLASRIPGVDGIGGAGTGGGGSWGANGTGFLSGLNLTPLGDKGNGLGVLAPLGGTNPFDIDSLIASGNTALNATSVDSGGYKKPKEPKKYVNPYVEWANSLIDNGPSGAALIRKALKQANKTLSDALREGYKEMNEALKDINETAAETLRKISGVDDDKSPTQVALMELVDNNRDQSAAAAKSIIESARSTAKSMRDSAASTVATARSALNSAASALAGAGSAKEAAAALVAVRRAQKDLEAAEKAAKKIGKKAKDVVAAAKKNADALRKGIDSANAILEYQGTVHGSFVQDLINGNTNTFASLADYAAAREFVAGKLEEANQKLADAIAMRDQFKTALSDSIKSFGALTTAQAKAIDGIEQALTANDIVENLQDRLDKIKDFQSNLQILLAQGLSDEAYRQILAQGVEGGTPFVDALIEGGQGAISATNELTGKIGDVANSLGLEASDRLYKAGVDAAQGLVDGLTSLSAKLDAAAWALGDSIARAVAKALGINLPSPAMLQSLGTSGVGNISRMSSGVATSPEVASYAASQRQAVSGNNNNDPKFLWTGDIVTPTEDPHAVATEAINEIVGRLP